MSIPITELEAKHVKATPRYIECDVPSLHVTGIEQIGEWTFRANWTYDNSSCVSGVTYSLLSVRWRALFGDPPTAFSEGSNHPSNDSMSGEFTPLIFVDINQLPLNSVQVVHATLEPDTAISYGGRYYWQQINLPFEVSQR